MRTVAQWRLMLSEANGLKSLMHLAKQAEIHEMFPIRDA
jgi:hypothetical protein